MQEKHNSVNDIKYLCIDCEFISKPILFSNKGKSRHSSVVLYLQIMKNRSEKNE
ncbi:hypothetical protein DSECCO2_532240 [anaerobic digester metagenome]|jgi:hypothetical protein